MMFWIIIGGAALLCATWMALPFLRNQSIEMNAGDSTLSIYRDQIDEVERDRAAGLISEAECDAARREIERRALHAARHLDQGFSRAKRSVPVAAGITILAVAVALGGYSWLGHPELPDRPLVARKSEELIARAKGGDLNSQIQLLVEATQKDPADLDSLILLAQAYAAVEDHSSAAEAYRKAIAVDPDLPELQSAYAETLTLANGNKVPPAARVIFEQVLHDTPDPRARYYVALAKAQAKDFEGALDDWAALATDSSPDAPWMPLVRRDITNMAEFLGKNPADYLPTPPAPQSALPAGHPAPAAAAQAIETLISDLKTEPRNHEGWIELARLYAATGRFDHATSALAQGRKAYAAAPFVLKLFDQAAAELGLQGADDVRGPDAQDVAAISELPQEDQDAMIDGMVAGLAERLADNPDNPGGWVMLVRSYVTLGAANKAEQAYAMALSHFEGNEPVLKRLRSEAGVLLAGLTTPR